MVFSVRTASPFLASAVNERRKVSSLLHEQGPHALWPVKFVPGTVRKSTLGARHLQEACPQLEPRPCEPECCIPGNLRDLSYRLERAGFVVASMIEMRAVAGLDGFTEVLQVYPAVTVHRRMVTGLPTP